MCAKSGKSVILTHALSMPYRTTIELALISGVNVSSMSRRATLHVFLSGGV
eukprot:SAG22_NODE_6715_length_820_cov_1.762829_2_plen_51_part_00